MEIHQSVNSVFESNTFIIHEDGKAVIVDIGDFEPVKTFIEENGLTVEALFLTHTHYDHIYGIRRFMENWPEVPIYTSSFGKEALGKSNWNFSRYHDDEIIVESDMIKSLDNGDTIPVLHGKEMKAIATPGHDKSCLSYIIDDNLFSGDSYIPGVKVVATFPNSDRAAATLWYDRLQQMSADHNLYPGHGNTRNSATSD